MKQEEDYVPFGDEWEKEMSKLPKAVLIEMYRKLASTPKVDGWISVDERLPENRQEVLCIRRLSKRMVQQSWEAHTDQNEQWFIKTYSHWKILPAPPTLSDLTSDKEEGR